MKSGKKIRWLLTFSIVCLLGVFAVNYVAPRIIIKTSNKIFKAYRYTGRGNIDSLPLEVAPLFVTTNDGHTLNGHIIYTPSKQPKGTIVFLHGIRAVKEIFIDSTIYIANKGYNSVLLDLRAHGSSEGEYCTFGYREKYDVIALIDTLLDNKRLTSNIGVWGQSLGGAVALQSMQIDKRIQFGIIESTFGDFRAIVHDYTHYNLKINFKPLTNYIITQTEELGGFDADSIQPINSAMAIKQPVLIVHGSVDNRINNKYGKKIYENLASEYKELIIIDSAKHSNVWKVGGTSYFERVFEFVECAIEK